MEQQRVLGFVYINDFAYFKSLGESQSARSEMHTSGSWD